MLWLGGADSRRWRHLEGVEGVDEQRREAELQTTDNSSDDALCHEQCVGVQGLEKLLQRVVSERPRGWERRSALQGWSRRQGGGDWRGLTFPPDMLREYSGDAMLSRVDDTYLYDGPELFVLKNHKVPMSRHAEERPL